MATPYTHNFAPAVNYTTVDKITFDVLVDGEPLTLTDAEIKMIVRDSVNSSKKLEELSTENQKITITDATHFDINERIVKYPNRTAEHGYDVLIKLPGDVYKTYVKGVVSIIATYQDPV
jgi:hypothetical protein